MDLSGSWDYIEKVAQSRLAHNKTSRHVSKWDYLETIGVAGEISTRRYLGLSEKVHDGFDHGVDFTFGGKTVDVKATLLTPKLAFRYLQWPVYKVVKADVIVLTAISLDTRQAVVVGYATKDEVVSSPINNTRFQPCHEISVRDLHPVWELIADNFHFGGQ